MSTLDLLQSAYELIESARPEEALRVLGPSPSSWPPTNEDGEIETALFEFYRAMAYRRTDAGDAAVSAIRRAIPVFHAALSRPGMSPEQAPEAILGIYFEAAAVEHAWGDRMAALRWSEEMYRLYNREGFQHRRTTDSQYPVFLNDMGALALELGVPGLARKFLYESSDAFSTRREIPGVCKSLINLATLEEKLGNREAALRLLRRAQMFDQETTENPHVAALLASMSLNDGDLQQCESILKGLEDHYRQSGSAEPDLGGFLLSLRARLLRIQGNPDGAIELLKAGIGRLTKTRRFGIREIELRLQLALHLGEQGKLADAIREANAVLLTCDEKGYRDLFARASSLLGGLYLLTGSATEAYELLSRLAQDYDLSVGTSRLGIGEITRQGNVFADHLALLPASAAAAGRLDKAILHMLDLRAEVGSQFRRIKSVMESGESHSSIIREYDGLHQAIDILGSLMTDDEEVRDEVAQHYAVLEGGLADRFDEISRLSVEESTSIQASISPSSIEFGSKSTARVFLCPSGPDLLAILLTGDGLSAPRVHFDARTLEDLVHNLFHDVRNLGLQAPRILRRLSELLWEPIEDLMNTTRLQVRRLLVSPFGWCHFIPFHLLTRANGKCLFEEFDVIYSSESNGTHVSPDWDVDRPVERVLFVSPFPQDLPGARNELASLESSGLRVDVLASRDCTRANLFGRLTQHKYDVVHLACHAVTNYARPALSYLEFVQHERCYLGDLLRECDCRGASVILSACDSTVAAASRVDLKNSLADAFHFSGAPAVIGSLWPLEDSAASEFIASLYAETASGASLIRAFNRAFRDFGRGMKEDGWNVRYWGALTLGVGR